MCMIILVIRTLLYFSTLGSFRWFLVLWVSWNIIEICLSGLISKQEMSKEMRLNCQPFRLVIQPSIQYLQYNLQFNTNRNQRLGEVGLLLNTIVSNFDKPSFETFLLFQIFGSRFFPLKVLIQWFRFRIPIKNQGVYAAATAGVLLLLRC